MSKQWKQWQTIFLGSKITPGGDCSHEIKRCLLPGRKAMTNLDSILKSRDIADKGPSRQSYGFSSSRVWMWELDYKESWVLKNRCFWTAVLEKTLESPLDCKEIQPVHPKGNKSWIFIGKTNTEAETPILWPPDSLEKTLMLEMIEGRWRRGWQRMRLVGWQSWTQWTWVWASSGSWWRTGKPDVLQSMELQRVGYDRVTELNWTERNSKNHQHL